MAFADYHKILLFGDSITEQSYEQTRGFGFGAAITDEYKRKLEVLCRGFSGYNTSHALCVLRQFIPEPCQTSRIKLVIIFFGANDAVLPGCPQHVPLDEYCENLKAIVKEDCVRAHDPKFILIAPAPVCEYLTQESDAARGKHGVQRTAARTKEYAGAAVAVGKELAIPTVDLWQAFVDDAGGWTEGQPLPGSKDAPRNERLATLLRDGLHFNPEGYKIMYRRVMETISDNYPELDPMAVEEYVFPRWEEAPWAR